MSIFDHNGYVKLQPNVYSDVPYKPKQLTEEEKKEIDICLNCTKPKCNGNCIDIRRKKNGKVRHY